MGSALCGGAGPWPPLPADMVEEYEEWVDAGQPGLEDVATLLGKETDDGRYDAERTLRHNPEPSGAWPNHPDDLPDPASGNRWGTAAGLRSETRKWVPCDRETHNLGDNDDASEFCGLLVGDVVCGSGFPVCGVCGLEVTVFVRKEQSDGMEQKVR